MKLKALLLIAASLSTLTVVASSLQGAAQQMWNPQMAEAAKVTMKLFHGKGLNPSLLVRSNRGLGKSNQPFAVPFAHSNELLSYRLKGRLSLVPNFQANYSPANDVQANDASAKSALREISGNDADSQMDQQTILIGSRGDSAQQFASFQNWVGGVEGTLKKQNYQLKKLEFELAQRQYQQGKISSAVLAQKADQYQTAAQEFKVFINSLKMAD